MARKRAGLSQEGLATAVGAGAEASGRSTVSNWENDKAVPDGRFLLKLPEVLNVSADWLLLGKATAAIASLPHEALVELRDWMERILPPRKD